MRVQFVAFAFAIGLSAPALAQIPRYDVEGNCIDIASIGGTYSNSMYNSCVEMEQRAYDTLKNRWSEISPQIKSHCDEIAKIGGSGSYSMLESCVEMEESAGSQTKTFKY